MASTAVKLITLFGGGNYLSTILSTGPIALWPLSETSGTAAADATGNGYTGTYTGALTLNATTFGDGTPAPLFDGTGEYVQMPHTTLDTPFDGAAGSFAMWVKVQAAAEWTSGVSRLGGTIGADVNNRVFFNKPTNANRFDMFYVAGGTSKQWVQTSFSPTTWFHIAVTWSAAADEAKAYINSAQIGTTLSSLGTWSGALAAAFSQISSSTTTFFWPGYIKYVGLWNRALTPAEVATLYVAGFAV